MVNMVYLLFGITQFLSYLEKQKPKILNPTIPKHFETNKQNEENVQHSNPPSEIEPKQIYPSLLKEASNYIFEFKG